MNGYRERIATYCFINKIDKKDLATVGKITVQSVHKFFAGSDVRASVVEKWAAKWPEMICEAFNLNCNKNNSNVDDETINYIIERVVESLESKDER